MTKKHFIAAARQVYGIGKNDPTLARHIGLAYAELFAQFNPRFDREKFLAACGL